jgi:prephenate dehydrogenase
MKVGIIGGTGKMGQLFRGVFERGGYTVLSSGRHTEVTSREIARQCDIVMVAVPIHATVPVIEGITPLLNPSQLLCDLTSLKVEPVKAMLRSPAQVAGFHPMFGPTVSSLHKQTIIATPVRCRTEILEPVLNLFRREGAVITLTTPEEHDRMMAVVQGLMHFVTLSMAETMRRIGTSPRETLAYMSPVYRIEMGLIGRLLAQDARLYADMLQMNPYVGEVLRACEESVHHLREIVVSRDEEAFIKTFSENAANFGGYCEQGMEETDTLIRTVVHQ